MYRKAKLVGVGVATGPEEAAAVRALLGHVRSSRRGRPSSRSTVAVPAHLAGYLEWELGELCQFLQSCLAGLDVDEIGQEAVVRCFGLAGPPERQADVAARLAASSGRWFGTRQLQKRMAVVLGALSAALPPLAASTGVAPACRLATPLPRPAPEVLRRWATDPAYDARLRLAVRQAVRGAGRAPSPPPEGARTRLSLAVALAQLEADAFGSQPPTDHLGRPIEPWLRWRLRALAWTTVVAVSPRLAEPPGAHRAGVEPPAATRPDVGPMVVVGPGEGALFGALLVPGQADADAIAAALDAVQSQVGRDPGARNWLRLVERALSGLGEGAPDYLWARALGLRLAFEARAGAVASFDTYHELLRVAEPDSPVLLTAAVDMSVMLAAHGHLQESVDVLGRHWPAVARGEHSDFLEPWYRLRTAIALQKQAADSGARDVLRSAEASVMRLAERPGMPSRPMWGDLVRVCAQIELTRATHHDGDGRRVARALDRAADLLVRAAEGRALGEEHSFRQSTRWALVAMEHALRAGDADAFSRAARDGAWLWSRFPVVPVIGRALHDLMAAGTALVGCEPLPLAPPHPVLGWDRRFRPSPRVLNLVDGRSWVCSAGIARGRPR